MDENIVNLQGVTKRFGELTAVENFDLDIRRGELLTLLGPSGCGKTTTLRMIAGFESPTEGRVEIAGSDMRDVPPYERDMGMVFQQFALFPHMTVSDNVAFGLEMEGLPKGEIDERVAEILEMVSLSEMSGRSPASLSGGQQQRVALARALVTEPSVLLLDEPLSSLDKKLREEMRLEVLRLHRELDVTMVYVTHNQDEALSMSDRMAVMADGQIQQVGSPDEIYQRPANEFVANFIGTANLFEGVVQDADERQIGLENGVSFVSSENGSSVPLRDGAAVTVLLRPEFLSIADGENGDRNGIRGTVRETTYYGSHVDYFVDVDIADVYGEHVVQVTEPLSAGTTVDVGEEAVVSFDSSAPTLIAGE